MSRALLYDQSVPFTDAMIDTLVRRSALIAVARGLLLVFLSSAQLVAQRGGPPRSPRVEWQFDGAAGRPVNLELVSGLGLLPDGRVALMDRDSRAPQLVLLSKSGLVERTIGRRGAGPGEFQSPTGLAVDPRGRIVVHDLSNARFSVFSFAGQLLTTVPHRRRPALGFNLVWDGSFDRDGRLFVSAGLMRRSVSPNSPEMFGDSALITEVWRGDLTRADSLTFCGSPPPLSRNPAYVERRSSSTLEGGRRVPSVGYSVVPIKLQTPAYARDRDGAEWSAASDAPTVLVRRKSGACAQELARVRLRPVPSRVPDAVRAKEVLKISEEFRALVPQEYPAFQSLQVDELNRLWVARLTTAGLSFEIFDSKGAAVSVLAAPNGLRLDLPYVVASGRVVGFTTDQDGVRSLVSWRYN